MAWILAIYSNLISSGFNLAGIMIKGDMNACMNGNNLVNLFIYRNIILNESVRNKLSDC